MVKCFVDGLGSFIRLFYSFIREVYKWISTAISRISNDNIEKKKNDGKVKKDGTIAGTSADYRNQKIFNF